MQFEFKSISPKVIISFLFFSVLFYPSIIKGAPKFIIHTSSEELKQETQEVLLSAYQRISRILGDTLAHVVTVYVADSDEEFQAKTGKAFPDWGIGCAIPSHHLIIVKSPAHFRYGKSLKQVLEHELAHIFLGSKAKGERIPRWLDEGFAMMQSHEWNLGQDIVVARAVFTNSIFPLSEIERLNWFNQSKAHLAYTLSFLGISYLFREYGQESFVELLDLLSQKRNLDEVFLKTTGSNYIDFQIEFYNHIRKRYQWIGFLGDTFFFWLGLAFLIIFVYLLKRRHAKRILKRWEEEEKSIQDEEKAY
jgi:hypothetical protein